MLAAAAMALVAAATVAWRVPAIEGAWGKPAADGARVFVVDGGIRAFDAADGRMRWLADAGGFAPRCVILAHDRVIAAGEHVLAIDPESGRVRWRFTPPAHAAFACPAADDRHVYVGTAGGEVIALDRNGRLVWSRRPRGDTPHEIVVRGIATDDDHILIAIEENHDARGERSSGWLYALRAADGEVLLGTRWGNGAERRGASATPVVAGTLVLVPDVLGNALVAIERASGRIVWTHRGTPGFPGISAAPLVRADTAYIASGDTHVTALDLRHGGVRWRTPISTSAGALAWCGDRLAVEAHGIVLIDPADGRRVSTLLDVPHDFVSSDLATHGTRLFGGGPRAIYAIDCRLSTEITIR